LKFSISKERLIIQKAFLIYIIKDEKWYIDEVSDTTMLPIAVSLFGQKMN
jgi:hypothetical protein